MRRKAALVILALFLLVDVPSDRIRWAAAVRNLALRAGDYRVHVELLDAQGHELGWNQFAFTVEPPQAETEEE